MAFFWHPAPGATAKSLEIKLSPTATDWHSYCQIDHHAELHWGKM